MCTQDSRRACALHTTSLVTANPVYTRVLCVKESPGRVCRRVVFVCVYTRLTLCVCSTQRHVVCIRRACAVHQTGLMTANPVYTRVTESYVY